jgi:hypothetical protein
MVKYGGLKEATKYNSDNSRGYTDVMVPVRTFGGEKYTYVIAWDTKKGAKEFAERRYVPLGFKYRIVERVERKEKEYLVYVRKA